MPVVSTGKCVYYPAAEDSTIIPPKKITIKPAFDFDQRFSFISTATVNIWGGRAGVLINEKFKVGAGIYFLNQRLKSNSVGVNGNPAYYATRSLYFGTLYFEPFLWRKTYWELSIVGEIGLGESIFKVYEGATNAYIGERRKFFFPTGVGPSLSLKAPAFFGWRPFRWVGINGLIGYRYDIDESFYNTDYNGMFWSISGALFLDRIFDDVRYWKKRKAEKDHYPVGTMPR